MQAIDTARQTLLDQLEPIDVEAAKLESRLDELNQDRRRLKAAIKALDATRKPKTKAAAKTPKPSPKQKDVRDVAIAIVQENPGIAKGELEDLTKDKLTTDLGFDLKGFEMRWNEVMGSNTFEFVTVDNQECVQLAGAPSAAEVGDRKDKDAS